MQAQTARAAEGFQLCNRTKLTVRYAKAYSTTTKEDRLSGKTQVVTSEGWFSLAPGACGVAWPGKLEFRFYLIYAEATASNRIWSGNISVCVENSSFKLVGPQCPTSKNHRMFFVVDTGDGDRYTYDLN